MNRWLIIFFFIPLITFGQGKGRVFTIGLKAGANFSQLKTLQVQAPRLGAGGVPIMSGGQVVYDFFQNNTKQTTGIVGGLFMRFGRTLFIQPELLVSSKGGTFDLVQTGLATQQVNVRFTTFDVPLLIGLKLGPLRLNAGPIASLTIKDDQKLKDAFNQYTTQPINNTLKQAVFGYQAGIGLSLGGLQLDARYEGNLSDLSQIGIRTPTDDVRFTTHTNLWQLTAGFAF